MATSANIPIPRNEPVLTYAPGTPERDAAKAAVASLGSRETEIPVVVGGKRIRTGNLAQGVEPHRHSRVVAQVHQAGEAEVHQAIEAAEAARREWESWRFEDRAAVFLRAADLLAGPWRQRINAATMLGQSKTIFQAEIDSACELIDFWRFNVTFAEQLHREQPYSPPGSWNRMDYRPLEGFVYAITPFNFTAIGGNLPTAPALMGNTVVWKPASTACLSNYLILELLEEAGLPPGVINFVPGNAATVSNRVLADRRLGGIHFTGSTPVFQDLWRQIGNRIGDYLNYPRIVGETGGKDFVLVHQSADPDAVAVALVRGAYEYQGQKCSAASRAYVPKSLWPKVRDRMLGMISDIKMGDVADFTNFMGAVIDAKAFGKLQSYLEQIERDDSVTVVAGGKADRSEGYFIEPTLVEVQDPLYRTMCEELFGPILSVYPYEDKAWEATLRLVDTTSPYALTGSIFSRDRAAVEQAERHLRHAAGNFYINDKPTGAVVGQQPFGGSRGSGTNDKAGSILNLVRWVSARSIKETFVPPTDYRYPFMAES